MISRMINHVSNNAFFESTSRKLREMETYVDPRSKERGWKVKVLDVQPDPYGGSTTATVEVFNPKGESEGEDNIFIHRQKVKVGKTYNAVVDGIMCQPKIVGVDNFDYDEVPDIREVDVDLYW